MNSYIYIILTDNIHYVLVKWRDYTDSEVNGFTPSPITANRWQAKWYRGQRCGDPRITKRVSDLWGARQRNNKHIKAMELVALRVGDVNENNKGITLDDVMCSQSAYFSHEVACASNFGVEIFSGDHSRFTQDSMISGEHSENKVLATFTYSWLCAPHSEESIDMIRILGHFENIKSSTELPEGFGSSVLQMRLQYEGIAIEYGVPEVTWAVRR